MLERGAGRAAWMAALVGLAFVGAADAGTFRFQDATGTVHYTNAPSDPRYQQIPGWPDARSFAARSSTLRARAVAPYAELIRAAAERHRVDPRLVDAVVTAESAGNPRAVSRKGAQGLMQLMPQRAVQLGVSDPFDPRQNVDGGVRHLRDLLLRFGGNVTLALAAYNAGEEAVRTYGGVPPYAETQEYVRRVRALFDGAEGPGPAWAVGTAPQQVYRQVSEDGRVTFTNVPPNPATTVKRRF